MHAIAELEAAFKYETGTEAERDSVLRPRILRVGSSYPHLKAFIARFSDPTSAWNELNRLAITFLPTAMGGAAISIKLSQLNTFLTSCVERERGRRTPLTLKLAHEWVKPTCTARKALTRVG